MLKKIKLNKKGFTLAELLIVIAVIAVLVAIAIPAFTGALDSANKAADEANIRAAFAEFQTTMLLKQDVVDKDGKTITFATFESTYDSSPKDGKIDSATLAGTYYTNVLGYPSLSHSIDISKNPWGVAENP